MFQSCSIAIPLELSSRQDALDSVLALASHSPDIMVPLHGISYTHHRTFAPKPSKNVSVCMLPRFSSAQKSWTAMQASVIQKESLLQLVCLAMLSCSSHCTVLTRCWVGPSSLCRLCVAESLGSSAADTTRHRVWIYRHRWLRRSSSSLAQGSRWKCITKNMDIVYDICVYIYIIYNIFIYIYIYI